MDKLDAGKAKLAAARDIMAVAGTQADRSWLVASIPIREHDGGVCSVTEAGG